MRAGAEKSGGNASEEETKTTRVSNAEGTYRREPSPSGSELILGVGYLVSRLILISKVRSALSMCAPPASAFVCAWFLAEFGFESV